MVNEYFSICVDGKPYEGSERRDMAKYLYITVDDTINREYDGHTKSLVQMGNRYDPTTWKKLFEDEIHCPQKEELKDELEDNEDEEEDEEPHYHFHR